MLYITIDPLKKFRVYYFRCQKFLLLGAVSVTDKLDLTGYTSLPVLVY